MWLDILTAFPDEALEQVCLYKVHLEVHSAMPYCATEWLDILIACCL